LEKLWLSNHKDIPWIQKLQSLLNINHIQSALRIRCLWWNPKLYLIPWIETRVFIDIINNNRNKFWIWTIHHQNPDDSYFWNELSYNFINSNFFITDASANSNIFSDIRYDDNYQKNISIISDLRRNNLDVLSTARNYLSVALRSIIDGDPIDRHTLTALNSKKLIKW
jgi:hypothetical protein